MSKQVYTRKKERLALGLSPIAGLLGFLPFVFNLNLSFGLFLAMAGVALVMLYLGGLILGAPVYFLLRNLGYADPKYLFAYAIVLSVIAWIVFSDIYAMVTFAPPLLLVTLAFCYLRGPEVTAEA